MVGDEDEQPGPVRLVDATRRVRDDERLHPEPSEDADAEHGTVGADSLVEMCSTAHEHDRNAVELAEHEYARVSDGRRDRPAGYLAVRDLDTVVERVGEPAQPAPEDDSDSRLELGLRPDPSDGSLDAHVEPSATRAS